MLDLSRNAEIGAAAKIARLPLYRLPEGRDPERPVRDQALATVDADDPAKGRIAQRAPLRGDRHSRPARQIILKDLRQIIFKMTPAA